MTSKPMLIAISAEQADRLYWLGRYVERVFSTVRIFNQSLDRMIDQDGEDYVAFCKCLSIPSDIYRDAADFEVKYLFDATNPDSIYSNLSRAYDKVLEWLNLHTLQENRHLVLEPEIHRLSLMTLQMYVWQLTPLSILRPLIMV